MATKKNGKYTQDNIQAFYTCPNLNCDKKCKRKEGMTRHKKTCPHAPRGPQQSAVRQPNEQQRMSYEHETEYDGGAGNNDFDNNIDMEDDVGDRELEKLFDQTVKVPDNEKEQNMSLLRLQRDFHLSNAETSAISKWVFWYTISCMQQLICIPIHCLK